MPDLLWCLFLEWGWWFWVPLIVAFLFLCWLLIRFLLLIVRGGRNTLTVGYEKLKVVASGAGLTGILITVLLVVLGGYAVREGYKSLRDNYFVALNTPGKELVALYDDGNLRSMPALPGADALWVVRAG